MTVTGRALLRGLRRSFLLLRSLRPDRAALADEPLAHAPEHLGSEQCDVFTRAQPYVP